jgi:quinol monooxygenase YgiN
MTVRRNRNETNMQYTNVETITTKPGQLREFEHKVEEELLPKYRALPGFIAFTIAKTGESNAVCVGVWETKQQVEQSITTSDQWLKSGMGKAIETSHNNVGELQFLALVDGINSFATPAVAGIGSRA